MDARQTTQPWQIPEAAQSQTRRENSEQARLQRELVWEHRLLWILLVAILALWGFHYFRGRVDRQLLAQVSKLLAEKFPRHRIQLDRVHLEEGQAILIEGLQISLPTSEGLRDVLKVQRIIALGKIELLHLLRRELPIQKVVVDGMEIGLWPWQLNRWSLESLASQDRFPASLPNIEVRSGLLRIGGSSIKDPELICHDLQAAMHLAPQLSKAVDVLATPPCYLVKGSVASGHFRSIQWDGWMAADKRTWGIRGKVVDLDLTERLLQFVPNAWQEKTSSLSGLTCRFQSDFELSMGNQGLQYDLRGSILQGRIENPNLPYLLEHLQGKYYCRNGLLQLRTLHASSDDTEVFIDADIDHLGGNTSANVHAQFHQLHLNQKLYQALPDAGKSVWDRLQVEGIVDAEVDLSYANGKWSPIAHVHCIDASVVPDVFPYPLHRVRGEIDYRDGVVKGVDLYAEANGQPLHGSLRLEKSSPRWLIDLEVTSEGSVPIDPALIQALTARNQTESPLAAFAKSLQPTGFVQLSHARFLRRAESPDVLSKSMELRFYSGTVLYSQFRYPIFDIQGQVTVSDDVIHLKNFEGRHDSARIACRGRYECPPGEASSLDLNFHCDEVPLQEGLRRALPLQVQELWNQAQPSGVLDEVIVQVKRNGNQPELNVQVEITENGPVASQTAQSVSLRPASLPYLLNDISFRMSYRPGIVDIEMRGYHDSSVVITDGSCRLKQDGSWGCLFHWLPETRLLVDRSLLSALPHNLRQPLETLEFRGPVNVGGWTLFIADPVASQTYAQSYDLQLDVEDGRLRGGEVATGIRGSIGMRGVFAKDGPIAVGSFDLDSMMIRQIPVTNLNGRFAIDGTHVLFGRDAVGIQLPDDLLSLPLPHSIKDLGAMRRIVAGSVPASQRPIASNDAKDQAVESYSVHPEDLRAKLLGGQLHIHGSSLLATGRVNLQLLLDNADFRELMMDLGQPISQARGRLFGSAQITGALHNTNTLSGHGSLHLREADLYQLPSMIKLFRLLSVRPPDNGAFESADIAFGIDGDRFPLHQFMLDGDLISLRGSGWVNMRKEVYLDLYTYVGRRGQIAALIGPLISGNDSATLLRIEVDGTTDNPQMKRSLPGLDRNLEQIFPDKLQAGKGGTTIR